MGLLMMGAIRALVTILLANGATVYINISSQASRFLGEVTQNCQGFVGADVTQRLHSIIEALQVQSSFGVSHLQKIEMNTDTPTRSSTRQHVRRRRRNKALHQGFHGNGNKGLEQSIQGLDPSSSVDDLADRLAVALTEPRLGALDTVMVQSAASSSEVIEDSDAAVSTPRTAAQVQDVDFHIEVELGPPQAVDLPGDFIVPNLTPHAEYCGNPLPFSGN